MKDRLKRVNELIKKEIGLILEEDFNSEGALVTVSRADVTPDLRNARVFVSIFPFEKKEKIMEKIKESLSRIQEKFGNSIKLKYTPKLEIVFDDSFERGDRLDNLFDKINHDKMSG